MSEFDEKTEQEEPTPPDLSPDTPAEPILTAPALEEISLEERKKTYKKGPRSAAVVFFVLSVIFFAAFAIISAAFFSTLFKISTTDSAGEAVFTALFAVPIFLVMMFFSGAPSLIFSIISTVLLGKTIKRDEKKRVAYKVLFGISIALLALTVATIIFTILYFGLNNN